MLSILPTKRLSIAFLLNFLYYKVKYKAPYKRRDSLLLPWSDLRQVWQSLTDNTCNLLIKLGTIYLNIKIYAKFLLVESYVQDALQKEPRISPFVEYFKITTLGKSH